MATRYTFRGCSNEFQEKPLPHELPHLSGIKVISQAAPLPGFAVFILEQIYHSAVTGNARLQEAYSAVMESVTAARLHSICTRWLHACICFIAHSIVPILCKLRQCVSSC